MKTRNLFSLIFLLSASAVSQAFDGTETVAVFGDSMTWIGGDNCEKETGWTYHFKQAYPECALLPYARSGATWTNTVNTVGDPAFYSAILNDENVVYDQVLRLFNDVDSGRVAVPDIIIAFAGGNDAWFEDRRPGIYDTMENAPNSVEEWCRLKPSQVTSLAGSIELVCDMVKNRFPETRLILVTPPEMSKTTPERIHKVGDTIEAVGNKLGLQFLRADRDLPFRHDVEKSEDRIYTYDGAHSNPTGAKVVCDYLAGALIAEPVLTAP